MAIRMTLTKRAQQRKLLRFLALLQEAGNSFLSQSRDDRKAESAQTPPSKRHDTIRHDTTRYDTTRNATTQDLGPATNIATADPNPNRTPGIKFARRAAIG
tara:strand:- start:43 stop:345 length:303 start_codon:yes stop_codon:yes gene_type:complete